jgi:hypothetical protein
MDLLAIKHFFNYLVERKLPTVSTGHGNNILKQELSFSSTCKRQSVEECCCKKERKQEKIFLL